jgi:methionyl-tRNA formyltransferase
MINNTKIAFFGSSKFSVFCLEELSASGILPNLIITTPDMPNGRGLKLVPTPVKIWAEKNKIPCLTPENLKEQNLLVSLAPETNTLFLVASYGKIIPKNIVELPKHGTLNIHPSLLPKYRGASPLQTQILNDEKEIGTTIMLMDEKMDHGPIISQKKVAIINWPVKTEELKLVLAKASVTIFKEIINDWLEGKINPTEQNHSEATFTKKIEKADGLIDLENNDSYDNFLKIQAYSTWPQAYFFIKKGEQKIRVIIKEAKYIDNKLEILRVLPEGKKEMSYPDFLRGLN